MAATLIERKAGEFDPCEFHDRYVDALKDLIAEKQKKKGEKVIQDPDADKAPPKGSNVIDLMAALKKSLGDDKRGKAGAKKAAAKKAHRQEAPPKSRHARGPESWRSAPASTSRPTTRSATSRRRRSRRAASSRARATASSSRSMTRRASTGISGWSWTAS